MLTQLIDSALTQPSIWAPVACQLLLCYGRALPDGTCMEWLQGLAKHVQRGGMLALAPEEVGNQGRALGTGSATNHLTAIKGRKRASCSATSRSHAWCVHQSNRLRPSCGL